MSTEDKILNSLKSSEIGMSIQELSKEINLERHTLTKYLNLLRLKGYINFKQVGMGKIWYMTKSPVLAVFEDDEKGEILKNVLNAFDDRITIIDNKMNVVWSNQPSKQKCYESFNQDSLCENCPSIITMKKGEKYHEVVNIEESNGVKSQYEIVSNPIKDNGGNTIAVLEITRYITNKFSGGKNE